MSQAKTQNPHYTNNANSFHSYQQSDTLNNEKINSLEQKVVATTPQDTWSPFVQNNLFQTTSTTTINNNNNNSNTTDNQSQHLHSQQQQQQQQKQLLLQKNNQQQQSWSLRQQQVPTTNNQLNGWDQQQQQQQIEQQEWTKNQNNNNNNNATSISAAQRSWAKIVQQPQQSSSNNSITNTSLTMTNAQSSSLNTSANASILTNSNMNQTKPSLSPCVNNLNSNTNSTQNSQQSSSFLEWDVKVNQQVPWSINDNNTKNQVTSSNNILTNNTLSYTNIVPTHNHYQQQQQSSTIKDQSLLASSSTITTAATSTASIASTSMKTMKNDANDLWSSSSSSSLSTHTPSHQSSSSSSTLLSHQNTSFWSSQQQQQQQNDSSLLDDKENTNWSKLSNVTTSQWSTKPLSNQQQQSLISSSSSQKRNYQETSMWMTSSNQTDQQLPQQPSNDLFQRQWSQSSTLQQQPQQQWDEQKPVQTSDVSSPNGSTTPSWSSKQQQQQGPIEPTGWEEPDTKIPKKLSDDGTIIWGDPEQARLVKIQKWTQNAKHVPNTATLKSSLLLTDQQEPQSQHLNMLTNSQHLHEQSQSNLNKNLSSFNAHQSTQPPPPPIGQQLSITKTQNWNNSDHHVSGNEPNNEWSSGLVDTTTWLMDSNKNEPKNNFDPSVGVIDTSKWFNTSTTTTTTNTCSLQSTPPQAMHSTRQQSDWSFNTRTQPLNTQTTTITGVPQNHSFLTRVPSNPQMQVPQSQLQQQQQQLLSSASTLKSNLSNTNLNQVPASIAQMPTPQGVPTNGGGAGAAAAPHIQNQLIESFKLAVHAGLINPDLLNTKLPQEVLTMLYQLFQYQTQYINCTQKLELLGKRRPQMNSALYKSEHELLQRELLMLKDCLSAFKQKIDQAYSLIKTKTLMQSPLTTTQQAMFSMGGNTSGGGGGVDSPLNEPLNQLHISKEQNSSKLVQLLSNEGTKSRAQSISSSKQYQPFGSTQNAWSSFGGSSEFESTPSPFDDRITPFVPGQIWSRPSPTSIEEDPHCTPGSASRSLLDTVSDPELRLGYLQAKSTWPDTQTTNTYIQRQPAGKSSWSSTSTASTSNAFNSIAATSQLGEQLWGTSNRQQSINRLSNTSIQQQQQLGGITGAAPRLSHTQAQQSQYYRGTSWNLNSPQQQQQQQQQPQWNQSPIQQAQFLLIRNISPKMDQTTLRTLCSQHGVVPYLRCANGFAIVKYNSKEEASNAHAKLNNAQLSGTSIQTQFISELEAKDFEATCMMNSQMNMNVVGGGSGGGSSSSGWPQQQQNLYNNNNNFNQKSFNNPTNSNSKWNSGFSTPLPAQYNQWNNGWSTSVTTNNNNNNNSFASVTDSLLIPNSFLQDD